MCNEKGLTAEMAASAVQGPCIYTFGSYRLGVGGSQADIDTLCIGPRQVSKLMCTRLRPNCVNLWDWL